MSLKILIDNKAYNGFTEAMGSRAIFNASGHFRFQTSPQDSIIEGVTPENYPLKTQRPCTLFVNDKAFITGFSDGILVNIGMNDNSVIIRGRDRTMDIIDSTLDGKILTEFTGGLNLKQICLKVIASLGISSVRVIDEVNPKPFTKGELINFQIGESAFSFLSKYADKRNVLLTTDGLGNLVITNGTTDTANVILTDSQILHGKLNLDTSQQYNKYVCYSQSTAAADLIGIDDSAITGTTNIGTAINAQIREGRQLVFLSDTPLQANEAGDRAIWESNFRQAMGFHFRVTVQGTTFDDQKSEIWRPNLSVIVESKVVSINSSLIVQTVQFNESVGGGTKTTLTLVPPNAYQLKLQQDYRQSLANQAAFPFAGIASS